MDDDYSVGRRPVVCPRGKSNIKPSKKEGGNQDESLKGHVGSAINSSAAGEVPTLLRERFTQWRREHRQAIVRGIG